MTHLAFLGAGRMATAMVRGVIARGLPPSHIAIRGGAGASAPSLSGQTGVRLAPDLASLVSEAEVLVLACKPQHLPALPAELATLTEGRLVLSVLAGVTTARLRRVFPKARAVVRAMPNTPGGIGAGVTPYSPADPLHPEDITLTESLLGALGKTFPVAEEKMDAVTAASGSGPGFLFEIVATMERVAEELGLTREEAALLVRETFAGSAKLLEKSGATPDALRDAVTSPNGTTYAGLCAMRARGMEDVLRATMTACRDRSRELSNL